MAEDADRVARIASCPKRAIVRDRNSVARSNEANAFGTTCKGIPIVDNGRAALRAENEKIVCDRGCARTGNDVARCKACCASGLRPQKST
ncbi:hypothetical protein [Microvirga sp. P5_D2]